MPKAALSNAGGFEAATDRFRDHRRLVAAGHYTARTASLRHAVNEREFEPRGSTLSRIAGWLWAAGWLLVLAVIAAPWRDLGGLVDERLRWLEWLVIGAGLLVGRAIGAAARDAARPGTGRSHLGFLRRLLYPPASVTALALIVLQLMGAREQVAITASAFTAYWAGFDLGIAALPLMCGERHSLRGSIGPSPDADLPPDADE